MTSQADFEKAVEDVKTLAKKPSDADLLKLYSLYKQATVGDAQGARPGMFDIVGRKKFDAWVSVKGKTQDEARKDYIEFVNHLRMTKSQ